MGPAFANLLEIGGDQYEYIQSVIVDDFLKGGGTISGMVSLLTEFDSELAGVAIFADNATARSKDLFDHKSLLKVTNIDVT